MDKSTNNAQTENEPKSRTSLYLKPSAHKKVKIIGAKEDTNPNSLFEQAIDEFIERWEKKNGEISI